MRKKYPVIKAVFLPVILLILCSWRTVGQTYCTPAYNFVDCSTLQRQLYIYNVQINNRTFSTGCSQAGYAGLVNRTANGISDPIILISGGAYSMAVNTADYNSRTYQYFTGQAAYAVWIDYDRNGTFDTSELVRSNNVPTFSFLIPGNAAGDYRMRIRVRPGTTTDDPCVRQDYGETEDYTLQIVPPTPTLVTYPYQYPCANTPFTLSATGCPFGTIQWRDRNDVQIGTNNVSTQTAQNNSYSASCVINGISGAASVPVYAYPTVIAPPSISSNNYNLTIGQSAALFATGCSGTVVWSTGQIGGQITVTPVQNTVYSATCSSYYLSNCQSIKSNEISISVNPPGVPTITTAKNSICPGETITLSASNCAGTVRWSTGASGSSISVTPGLTTTYTASCLINGVEGAKAGTTVTVNLATTIS